MYSHFLDLININSDSSQRNNSKSVTDRIHVFCYDITKCFTKFLFFIGKIEVKFTYVCVSRQNEEITRLANIANKPII